MVLRDIRVIRTIRIIHVGVWKRSIGFGDLLQISSSSPRLF